MKHEWSGDVDLGNGEMQNNHANYLEYLNFVSGLGLNNRKTHDCIKEDLQRQCSKLNDEKDFLGKGHSISGKNYKKNRKQPMLQRIHYLHVHGNWRNTASC